MVDSKRDVSPEKARESLMDYSILGWVVVGLIAGALGKLIMPGKDPGGIVITMLLGIAGAFVGGYIASMVGIGGSGNFVVNILVAAAGAVLLLWVYRLVKTRQAG
jgi:uncharacterized membrane protein YeaQ/YmgE (transglycosylase-associated protein family)